MEFRPRAVCWAHLAPQGYDLSSQTNSRPRVSPFLHLSSNIRCAYKTDKGAPMAGVILFALILILSFGVLIYFLKPTSSEVAVEQHLEGIDAGRATGADGIFVRKQKFSSTPWLE